MKKVKIILMFVSALFIVSCESSTFQDISAVVTDPTYSKNIAPVLSAQCVGCHSNGSQYPPLESYADVMDATQNGSLLCRINGSCGNVMPATKMPQATIDMIQRWADNGYKN